MLEKGTNSLDGDDNDLSGYLKIGLDKAEAGSSGPWRSLFHFTSRRHVCSLTLALFFSIASGIVAPALALFLGKVFDQFSEYGSGKVESKVFIDKVTLYAISLCGLGAASGILNGAFYGFWLAFGELQASSAREQLFTNLLDKEVEWFDMRATGIETVVSRLQR